jgi:hypothetical protein
MVHVAPSRIASALVLLAVLAGPRAGAEEPRREDFGDLIVLHLYGSYYEMGRQQAELMEEELRAVYELQRAEFERTISSGGLGAIFLNRVGLPFLSWIGPLYERSGLDNEIHGIADGLGVARRDLLRALFALTSGSTVFAATRSATADGNAIIGRNVDWDDAGGRRRPVALHYHPTNGDLAYISCGWPLVGLPTVGLNEAGFALSYNYFLTEPMAGTFFPQWPHRRSLQTARTVEEGIRVFTETRELGISTYMVMADAAGEIAMVECTPSDCAVYRPEGDWFGQANHARTEEMIPRDLYRSPDSFSRRAAMENAVRRHLGRITPEIGASILRDRSNSSYANASTVANLAVLNAVVVQPATGTLWHSTTMQPHAPFGAYEPFSISEKAGSARPIPADPRLANGTLSVEASVVAEARRGLHLFDEEKYGEAAEVWDALAEAEAGVLDPYVLAFARAQARWLQGEFEEAYALLEPTQAEPATLDTRAWGLGARGLLADRLGRREEALKAYERARALIDSHPEYNTFSDLRRRIEAGLDAPQTDAPLPKLYWFLAVPR